MATYDSLTQVQKDLIGEAEGWMRRNSNST